MFKNRFAINLALGVLTFCVVQNASAQVLRIHCSSEDDGELNGQLNTKYSGNFYFDGVVGTMSTNKYLDIKVHAENFERIDSNRIVGLVGICGLNNIYHAPLTCGNASRILFEKGKSTSMTIFSLAQMDPEGLSCQVSIEQ